MHALIVITHDSRMNASNQEINTPCQQLIETNSCFSMVEHTFLELAYPDVLTTFDNAITQ